MTKMKQSYVNRRFHVLRLWYWEFLFYSSSSSSFSFYFKPYFGEVVKKATSPRVRPIRNWRSKVSWLKWWMKLYQASSFKICVLKSFGGLALHYQPWRAIVSSFALRCLRVLVSSFAFRLPAVEREFVFLSFVFSGCFCCCCWFAAAELLLLNWCCCWFRSFLEPQTLMKLYQDTIK